MKSEQLRYFVFAGVSAAGLTVQVRQLIVKQKISQHRKTER